MIELIYKTLESVGFTHPIHPAMTHIPMGMAIGAFLFRIGSYKIDELAKTAHYCLILALIFMPPTALLGIMDWKYRYMSKMSDLIIAKMALAFALTVFLALTIYLFKKRNIGKSVITILYLLCMCTAIPLGYIGGKLIFD